MAYGGARGGAKSHGARAINLFRRIKYPGTNSLFLRKTFPELLSNIINPMFATWPQLKRYYNSQNKILTLPTNPPSITEFRTANEQGRIERIQGSEYADVFIEEGTQFSPEDIVWLQTVNRYVGPHEIDAHMVLTCNPGGIGHAYIKRVFVDRDFRGNERPQDHAFIQSFAQDNVYWSLRELRKDGLTIEDYYGWSDQERFRYFVERSEYGQVLNALPDILKGPHLFGDWQFFSGQYFDVFDTTLHVVERDACAHDPSHKVVRLEKWWPKWIAMDWGWTDDSAIYWFTADPQGNTYVYREIVINNMTADRIGALIGQVTQAAGETIEEFDLSRDAFAQKQSERTVAIELGDGVRPYDIPEPQFADQDRVGGWQLCYQLFQAGRLFITRDCPRLIALLPTLIRDIPNEPNDVVAVTGDDPADAFRYGIKTRARLAVKPQLMEVEERVMALNIKDPTSAMVARRRIMAEVRDQDAPAMQRAYGYQEELSNVDQ